MCIHCKERCFLLSDIILINSNPNNKHLQNRNNVYINEREVLQNVKITRATSDINHMCIWSIELEWKWNSYHHSSCKPVQRIFAVWVFSIGASLSSGLLYRWRSGSREMLQWELKLSFLKKPWWKTEVNSGGESCKHPFRTNSVQSQMEF